MKWYGTTYQPEWNNDSVAYFEADIETILSEKGFTWIPLEKKIQYTLPYDWLIASAPVNWDVKYLKCDLEIEGQPPLYFFRKDMNKIQAISKDNQMYVDWVFEMDYYYTYFRDMFNILLAANPEVQTQRCFTNRWSKVNWRNMDMSLNFNDSWWFKNQLPISLPLNSITNYAYDVNNIKILNDINSDITSQYETVYEKLTLAKPTFKANRFYLNMDARMSGYIEGDMRGWFQGGTTKEYSLRALPEGSSYTYSAIINGKRYYIGISSVYEEQYYNDRFVGIGVETTWKLHNGVNIYIYSPQANLNEPIFLRHMDYRAPGWTTNISYNLGNDWVEAKNFETDDVKVIYYPGYFEFQPKGEASNTILEWTLYSHSGKVWNGDYGIYADVVSDITKNASFEDPQPSKKKQWSYAIVNSKAINPSSSTNPWYDEWNLIKNKYNQSYFLINIPDEDYIVWKDDVKHTESINNFDILLHNDTQTQFQWSESTVISVFNCSLPPSILFGNYPMFIAQLQLSDQTNVYFAVAVIDSKSNANKGFKIFEINYDFSELDEWNVQNEPYFMTEQFKDGNINFSNNTIINIPFSKYNYDFKKTSLDVPCQLAISDGLYLFLDQNYFIDNVEKNSTNDSYGMKISWSDGYITTSYANWLAQNSTTEATSRLNLLDEQAIMNRNIETMTAQKQASDVSRWLGVGGSTIENVGMGAISGGLGGAVGGVLDSVGGIINAGFAQNASDISYRNSVANMKTSFGMKERSLNSQFENIREAPPSINMNNNTQSALNKLTDGFLLTEKSLQDQYKQAVMLELMDYGYIFGGVVPIKKYNNRDLYNVIQINVAYNFDKLLQIIKQNYFGVWNYQLAILKFLNWLGSIHRLYKTNSFDIDKSKNVEISWIQKADQYKYTIEPKYYYNPDNIVNYTITKTDIISGEVKTIEGSQEILNNLKVFSFIDYETQSENEVDVAWMFYDKYDIFNIDNPQHTGILGVYNATRDQAGTIVGPVSGAVWLEPQGHVSSIEVTFDDGTQFTYAVDWTYYQDCWISNSSIEGDKVTLNQSNYQAYQCHNGPWEFEGINNTNNVIKTWTGSTLDGSDWLFAYQHLNDINMVICDDNNINIANGLNTLGNNYCDSMFRNCSHLTGFGSDFLQPQNVKSVGTSCCDHMFENCINLSSLPENFTFFQGLSSAGDYFAANMFTECSNLTHLPSGFNVAINITEIKPHFLQNMFAGCTSLSSLPPYFSFPSALSSPIVGDSVFADTFVNCKSLSSLPQNLSIPQAITQVGRDFCISLFDGCSNLTSLPSNFNLPQNISTIDIGCFAYMFKNCSNLSSLPSNFNLPQNIVIPQPLPDGNVNPAGNYFLYDAFSSCSSLGLANHSSEESPYYFTIPSVFPDNFYFGTWFVDGQNEDVWVSSFPEKKVWHK